MPRKSKEPGLKATKVKAPVGRPTKYNPELALRICEEFATCTESYELILLRNPDFPARQNMRLWRYRHPEFRAMYMQARADQADLMIEDILEIADDATNDWMLSNAKDNPGWVINGEAMARSRLRIDTRKWVACKLLPKIYGEKKVEEPPPDKAPEIAQLTEIINKLVTKYEREY